MPLNVIIIAALGIIILVVMIVIFGGRIKLFSQGTNSCEGDCVATKAACGNLAPVPSKNCDANGDGEPDVEGPGFCCMEVG